MFNITEDHKAAFAAALIKHPESAFEAARDVFGQGREFVSISLWASVHLLNDPFVKFIYEKLREVGESNAVPTKEQAALKAWKWSEEARDHKDKAAHLTLFCKIMKYIDNNPTAIINNNINSKVMEVPVYASKEEWEMRLKEQQDKLTNQNVH